ncbi:MAG: HEAT repeat domain-containing protein [Rhodoglobus sp.]
MPIELSHSERLRYAARAFGEQQLAERAAALLETGREDPEFLGYLGGKASPGVIDGSWPRYWAQSWGARALEYYWVPSATRSVVAGLDHEAWRVRMVCARVCAVREIAVPEKLSELTADKNWRVRDAAAWALGRVGESEHAGALILLSADEDPKVRERAEAALKAMAERLDRPVDGLGAEPDPVDELADVEESAEEEIAEEAAEDEVVEEVADDIEADTAAEEEFDPEVGEEAGDGDDPKNS